MEQLQQHLLLIVSFLLYILPTIIAIILMLKAEDRNWLRRIIVIISVMIIYFNKHLSMIIFSILGSIIESIATVAGAILFVVLCIVLALLPIILVIHWLFH